MNKYKLYYTYRPFGCRFEEKTVFSFNTKEEFVDKLIKFCKKSGNTFMIEDAESLVPLLERNALKDIVTLFSCYVSAEIYIANEKKKDYEFYGTW